MILLIVLCACRMAQGQREEQDGALAVGLGKLRLVYEWKQITYNTPGGPLLQDRFAYTEEENLQNGPQNSYTNLWQQNGPTEPSWQAGPSRDSINFPTATHGLSTHSGGTHQNSASNGPMWQQNRPNDQQSGPTWQQNGPSSARRNEATSNGPSSQQNERGTRRYGHHGMTKADSPTEGRVVFRENTTGADSDFQSRVPDSQKYYIQYNNVPMGVEQWRNKLFITMPRRRYGIPSTLNYVDLNVDKSRSPALRPYAAASRLVSVYRTRADACDRLWVVDTGLLEIPDARRQVQQPAIVIFDLNTDREIHRYQLRPTDLVSDRTPGGFATIAVDVDSSRCDAAFAYVVDLVTYGIIVYSLKDNDSWRVNHNFFSFSPLVGKLNIAGQEFSWNDGIFSIALGARQADGYRIAYFHPMVSFEEFGVSTRVLRNRTLATREFHGDDFKLLGSRGARSQSTAHDRHERSDALLFAEIGRDAVSCWNTRRPLAPANKVTLAQHPDLLVYPSDIHITGDTVWVMSNQMPRFIYSRLDPNQYNFRVFKGDVNEMIRGTACEPPGRLDHTRPTYSG